MSAVTVVDVPFVVSALAPADESYSVHASVAAAAFGAAVVGIRLSCFDCLCLASSY